MKLFVKLMMLVLVAAVAGLFFVRAPGSGGQPILTPGGLWRSAARMGRDAIAFVDRTPPGRPAQESAAELYRWQDEDGVWHYADTPNAAGDGERITVDGERNVVHMPQAPIPAEWASEASRNAAPGALSLPLPGRAGQVMDDARALQGVMDARAARMDQATRDQR